MNIPLTVRALAVLVLIILAEVVNGTVQVLLDGLPNDGMVYGKVAVR